MAIGRVYLVGAGPGDPGLLTLKGLRCLQQADLVLYDGLVNPLLLKHAPGEAHRTCRVESPTGRVLRQEEINAELVAAALAGKTVVRLKGGDPYIFGRGSEEAAALASAGIPFEVIPGITAATAAAVYAGLSLTHREHSSAVAFITGHEDPTKSLHALDYPALARFPGTLVFYMGLHRLPQITASLIAAGKPAETPALVISRATTPLQRTVSASLGEIGEAARTAALHAPSLVIIGECVTMREQVAWFEHRPLFGLRIGITRPEEQADAVAEQCWELGAFPILMPTIHIRPVENWSAVDAALTRISEYDWLIFTSVNGVKGLLGRLWQTGGDMRRLSRIKLAAIGPATAESLQQYGLRADVVPTAYRAEALAAELKPLVHQQRILWARASRGRDILLTELAAAGATIDPVVCYQNLDVTSWPATVLTPLEQGEVDWIGLSSPSIARNLPNLLPASTRALLGTRIRLASISPVTTAAAESVGLPISAEATDFTWSGIFAAIHQANS